jgi:ABC-type uncharacterized transport system involved in gliding motility auxiliary subunit
VIGDPDFASNAYFTAYGNSDLILNSIDWAAGQEDLINLTADEPTQRILIPPETNTLGLITLISIFVLPGIVVLSGVGVWIARRRRG